MTKSASANEKLLHNVTRQDYFVLQAHGFCTDYSLPVSCKQDRSCLAPFSLKSLQTKVQGPIGGCSVLVAGESKTSDISNSCFVTCSQSIVLKHLNDGLFLCIQCSKLTFI